MIKVTFQIHGSPETEFLYFHSINHASSWIENNFLEFSMCQLHVVEGICNE